MTFKELKIGDFFIPVSPRYLKLNDNIGLLKKIEKGEVRSMSSGIEFWVHNGGLIWPKERVMKIEFNKDILAQHYSSNHAG